MRPATINCRCITTAKIRTHAITTGRLRNSFAFASQADALFAEDGCEALWIGPVEHVEIGNSRGRYTWSE